LGLKERLSISAPATGHQVRARPDHHGQSAGRANLLVRAVDGILGTHTLRIHNLLLEADRSGTQRT
jgi:hypothetical protein